MKTSIIIVGLFIGLFSHAQTLLGSTKLSQKLFDSDVDIITLGTCRGNQANNPVSEVKVEVDGNDIFLKSIIATFGNGQTQEFDIDRNLDDGANSGWIDLRGNKRCITSFRVEGNTKIRISGGIGGIIGGLIKGSATVRLYGRRVNNNNHNNGNFRVSRLGALNVRGSRRAGRRGNFRRHNLFVNKCRIHQIQIKARKGRFFVRNFKIHYRNGDVQPISFKATAFRNGKTSRWVRISQRRRGRCIDKVTFGAHSPNRPNRTRFILRGK